MKRAMFRSLIFVSFFFFLLGNWMNAQDNSAMSSAPRTQQIKLLTIGNSFSASLKRYFESVVNSVPGCSVDLEQLTIGGCSLERHWKNITKETENPGKKAFFKCTYQEKLQSKKWDFVSIQQASHYSWMPETYFPFAENICNFVKKNAPSAEVVIQQTWSYRHDDPRLAKWKLSQDQMYDRLAAAYNQAAEKLGLRVIPVGFAVQLARKNQPGGYGPYNAADYKYPDLPDINKFFTGNFTWNRSHQKIEGDRFHLNRRGEYLQACVWFAFLFERDAREVTFVPDVIAPEDAKFIREMAQKAVSEFKQIAPKK